MLNIALLGSGRMAHVYGPKINAHPQMNLAAIFNPRLSSAQKAAAQYGGRAEDSLDDLLAAPDIDAVVIATPTNTHLEYIGACAKAGKPIYCEKPLDLNLERVDHCLDMLATHRVPFMLGFNRRFDPDVAALKKAVDAGDIGALTFLMSWSREPAPPPIQYVKQSGGYFVDGTIHDIDLMCWITNENPSEVFAAGSCLFDPEIGAEGDFDATMTTLKMPSGCIVHINNSRKCAYGFDQRIEAFGRDGMLQTQNHRDQNLIRSTQDATQAKAPLKHFFLERYDASFGHALDAFYQSIMAGAAPSPSASDGRNALAIALACTHSAKTGETVKPDYI
ncbi:inositol 2-dehydrogenase [Maritalea myrionectae]|uniref:Inositol 2-dehydrogenase n=1 Tax=Maritalea myrionectae TaxID=454601 RepID=A0A2R4MIM9_9HYPH|nr:inositol 2-dehydrogenase [Maritalea myrionectae]AVX05764.1 inositol 2-dehydrogenase [Maritalea myrionectae]